MKKLMAGIAGVTALVLLGGCADGYGSGGVGMSASVDYDDGYYDGSYGPFYDGYWANDGYFYYSDAEGHPFRRDEARHFRHDHAAGFNHVHGHGTAHAPVAHGGPAPTAPHERG